MFFRSTRENVMAFIMKQFTLDNHVRFGKSLSVYEFQICTSHLYIQRLYKTDHGVNLKYILINKKREHIAPVFYLLKVS